MVKTKYMLSILFLIAVSISAQAFKKYFKEINSEIKSADIKSIDKNKDGKVFQCPMDWAIIKDKSGQCEKCKMNLKEYDVVAAETNLNKYLKAKEKTERHDHSEMKSDLKASSVKIKAWNEVCPLDGEKVNITVKKSDFKGKKIAFCCDDCKVTFDKHPEKFMKNLSKDGKKYSAKK